MTKKFSHKPIFEKILAAIEEASQPGKGGFVYCPSNLGFQLDMLSLKEEERFLSALRKSRVVLISIPIKGKKRFEGLAQRQSLKKKDGSEISYLPPKTVWAWSNGTLPSFVTVIK